MEPDANASAVKGRAWSGNGYHQLEAFEAGQ
jgi:hypothetical protein